MERRTLRPPLPCHGISLQHNHLTILNADIYQYPLTRPDRNRESSEEGEHTSNREVKTYVLYPMVKGSLGNGNHRTRNNRKCLVKCYGYQVFLPFAAGPMVSNSSNNKIAQTRRERKRDALRPLLFRPGLHVRTLPLVLGGES